ncbi:FUSC family protein [Protaetiibacter intestinalis]|uniref:FUSC family protein n=1 Tax=Protaetiibacter intestinalis TaxID=2419774 RepID=UPI00130091F7|nr:FUSC family protein [Protaetiibacter intestinalis]
MPVVLAITLATVDANAALFASLAALLVVLSERSGTLGQRLFRSGAGLGAGIVAEAFGSSTGGTGWIPLAALLGFGLVAGVLSSITSALSFASMQLLVQVSIACGLAVEISRWERLTSYIAGGLFAIAVMVVQSAIERTSGLYLAAADGAERAVELSAFDPENVAAASVADRELDLAQDLITWARPIGPTRRALVEKARAKYANALVKALGVATQQPAPLVASVTPGDAQAVLREAIGARSTWALVGRLEACLLVGELVRQASPLGHGYWITLTIALCLKPDFAPVFTRTVQRGVGTLLGLVVGVVFVLLPSRLFALALLVAAGGAVPYTVRRNYGWFAFVITPQVFVLLELGQPVSWTTIVERAANTLIGCVIVLTVGNALWPATWARGLRHEADLLDADIDEFLSRAAQGLSFETAVQRLALSRRITALKDQAAVMSETSISPQRYRLLAEDITRIEGRFRLGMRRIRPDAVTEQVP